MTRASKLLEKIKGTNEAKDVTITVVKGSVKDTYLLRIPAGGPNSLVKDIEKFVQKSDAVYVDTGSTKIGGARFMQVRLRAKVNVVSDIVVDYGAGLEKIQGVASVTAGN